MNITKYNFKIKYMTDNKNIFEVLDTNIPLHFILYDYFLWHFLYDYLLWHFILYNDLLWHFILHDFLFLFCTITFITFYFVWWFFMTFWWSFMTFYFVWWSFIIIIITIRVWISMLRDVWPLNFWNFLSVVSYNL